MNLGNLCSKCEKQDEEISADSRLRRRWCASRALMPGWFVPNWLGAKFPIGSVPNVGRDRHQPAGEQRSKYDAAPEGCSEHADRDVREFFVASADSQRRTLQSVPRLHEADKLAIVARRYQHDAQIFSPGLI
jgi:hypothetical protein